MRNCALIILALLFIAVDSSAEAQYRGRGWYRGGVGYGSYGGYGGYASNPVEGARYGLADVIRASGEAAESTTRAMGNYEDARSKYIDNKMKWTETYWQRKRLGESERRKDYDAKRKSRDAYLAKKGSGYPPRLTTSELDPSTGKIYWPQALLDDAYSEYREQLDEIFVLGAHTGSLSQHGQQIHELSRAMQDELKKHIRSLQANDYIHARKFLESLAFEPRHPAG